MSDEEYKRPSPDVLLKLAQKEEDSKKTGKLTIYFGAAPGVGKTYTMLSDARLQKLESKDIVVGYVETHGRPETDALLLGQEILKPLILEHSGIKLKEVDLEKIFSRKPSIVLIDELAHTNAPGSRNAKRYQDIQEILNAGIDVHTTLNVQHIESLNDTIFQITGIKVRETVPDTFLESAYEMKLVDLPPEELLKRLSEGKVYVKDMAELAFQKFFRFGNLLALRQMALRIVAGSVDDKMRGYMQAHAIAGIWPVAERILVGVFASPFAEKMVRSAFRLSHEIGAEWIAIYVETERHKQLSEKELDWLNKAMDLAKKLGAEVEWIKGNDVSLDIANYAQKNNVTKIVIGKPRHSWFFKPIQKKMLTETPNIDIYLMDAKVDGKVTLKKHALPPSASPLKYYAVSICSVVATSLIAFYLRDKLSEMNLLFLLLLPTTLISIYLGRGPSIAAAILSILIFNYLFVIPYYTFMISDYQYFLSYIVCLAIVLIISSLAYRLRNEMELLRLSEAKNTAIYGLSRDLVKAHNLDQVLSDVVRHSTQIFRGEMAIFLPVGDILTVKVKTHGFEVNPKVLGVASWTMLNKQAAGCGTGTFPHENTFYLPMMTQENLIGVIGFLFQKGKQTLTPENQVVIETIARLAAMAIERIKTISIIS